MPSLNLLISPLGPIIDLHVGVSKARKHALAAAGLPVPPDIACRLLVDTGASSTNVCQSIITQLGSAPTGMVNVATPSTGQTPVAMPQYDARLVFTFPDLTYAVDAVPVICADFVSQNIHGLLGRDQLERATLVYHGPLKLCVLSF